MAPRKTHSSAAAIPQLPLDSRYTRMKTPLTPGSCRPAGSFEGGDGFDFDHGVGYHEAGDKNRRAADANAQDVMLGFYAYRSVFVHRRGDNPGIDANEIIEGRAGGFQGSLYIE